MVQRYYCYSDAGGTFTDTFIIDDNGTFWYGKAPSTPKMLADGHLASVDDALDNMGIGRQEFFPNIEVAGFGTTAIVNTVLTRSGIKTGAIVTKGFESVPRIGRAIQTMSGYSWENVLHSITHRRLPDIIPLHLIKGVTERIDCYGEIMIPLYEHEVEQAAKELLDEEVEAIIVVLIYSYMNPTHEHRVKEIVEEVVRKAGKEIPVYASVDIAPLMRETNRFNAVAIEASAGSVARRSIFESEKRFREAGARRPLQVVLSHGGLCSAAQAKMIETAMSGPVGGLIGAAFIGSLYGLDNIITTDMGGTSFDVGLITAGQYHLNLEPTIGGYLINVPYAQVDSIGAGGGTIAYLDPLTNSLKVGPQSAGAEPGPACYGLGGTEPTVTDADVVLGYIDPDYFLGGKVKLNKDLAVKAIKERIADPLGISVEAAAWGIKQILDTQMENYCRSLISSKGYAVEDYVLMAFGGAGPTHAAGYTKNTNYKAVAMFPYSSVFCAFGAATADFSHQYMRATNLYVPYKASDELKVEVGKKYNELWEEMEQEAYAQFEAEGYSRSEVEFDRLAFVRYAGQIDELMMHSPVSRINSPSDMDRFIEEFENVYSRVYTSAARYPEAGYLTLHVGLIGRVRKTKPQLVKHKLEGETPPPEALKGYRDAYFEGAQMQTTVYDFFKLRAGNVVYGPAIIENINTTYVIPPEHHVYIDEYLTLWLRKGGK